MNVAKFANDSVRIAERADGVVLGVGVWVVAGLGVVLGVAGEVVGDFVGDLVAERLRTSDGTGDPLGERRAVGPV